MKTIEIQLPTSCNKNTAITTDNRFIADSNDGSKWDRLKLPLPTGVWSILKQEGNCVILIESERTRR
jgi:hypothetical protein